ncbi:fluoride efflux transporter CrcB [Pelagibaculum spongiae]|uniref:Fluoride-specific ion channel FluC n=1 Tax=Pelagibaculum spongiae TaxID=2080658 RepID=A0A2V1GQ07_9GAMM|nr:fluoride efflux transporter CrcB [Pelagibaculum spongiae]PVZ65426.1 fluoride efflux transporter CrcB [Pelagibaculum spongiae]
MLNSIIAISAGASIGATLRWLIGSALNSLFPSIPPGTLIANLLGAYLIGLALAMFAHFPSLAPEWKLLVITGFLGSLTTFSTFSAEITGLLQQGRIMMAAGAISLHLFGSLIMTSLGMFSGSLLK